MPVPIIVAGAAAIAARLAAKKVAQEVAKKAAKAAAAKTAQIAKNSVRVKPARKQIPNPPDAAKARYKKEFTNYKQRAREDDWVKEDINLPRSPKKTPIKVNSSNSVKVKYNKQSIENAIKDAQLKTKRPDMSPSRPIVSRPGSGRAIKINSAPSKTADAAKAANAKALKSVNKSKNK